MKRKMNQYFQNKQKTLQSKTFVKINNEIVKEEKIESEEVKSDIPVPQIQAQEIESNTNVIEEKNSKVDIKELKTQFDNQNIEEYLKNRENKKIEFFINIISPSCPNITKEELITFLTEL